MRGLIKFVKEMPVFLDVFFLIISVFFVHLFFVLYVHPISIAELEVALQSGTVPERTFWLILKDFEQEICLILSLWCILMLGNRYKLKNEDNQMIALDFLLLDKKETDLQIVQEKLSEAEQLGVQGYLLPGVRVYVESFVVSKSPENAKNDALEFYNLKEEFLDTRLNLINYILWAIPSVGFLGTVRGIGQALADVDQALSGDISGVALNLGIAFNSTFVAILLSVFLTFVSMAMRGREADRLVQCRTFISENLNKKFASL